MNADLDDDDRLTTALRDRMEGVRPDLDRLVAVATRQGTRIRRRTRLASLGGALGVAAVIGAIAVGTTQGDGPSGARGEQPGFAGEPSTPTSASPSDPAPSEPAPSDPAPSLTPTTAPSAPQTHRTPKGERSPVVLDLSGWTCGPPADEKFICTSAGDSVVVNWRPAAERHYWGNNPDKSADFISDVHGKFFVTVVALAGTPGTAAVAVGQALTWTD